MNRFVHKLVPVLLAVGVGATTVACSSAGNEDSVKVAIQEPYSLLLFSVAKEQGFLDEEGIGDIETSSFNSVPSLATAVSKSQMDIGLLPVQTVLGYNGQATEGSELKILSSRGVNLISYLAATGSDIPVAQGDDWKTTVQSWRGKTLGIAATGGISEKYLMYMLEEAGLDPAKDVTIVPVGAGAAMQSALKEGLIDVAGGSAGVVATIVSSGTGKVVLEADQMPDTILDTMTSTWVASQAALDKDGDKYRRIISALERARAFVADETNRDVVVATIVENIDMTPEEAGIAYDTDRESIANSPVTQEAFDRTIQAYTETDFYTGPPVEYDDFVSDLAR
jgi:NitT/TauT family transport system substrate-binding protein